MISDFLIFELWLYNQMAHICNHKQNTATAMPPIQSTNYHRLKKTNRKDLYGFKTKSVRF
ncbi:hypothetical protein NIASO_07415 [Niabella soli DSM 19437]|uniref:Uncharacterized protein n=1 Tax=Niabella soli DSM 19437 TaxID=929713 RepID=W0F6I7_9BACT|nr:hypothetical protein NIASO_07415 [Niabella soli DSM 19437]